MPSELARERIVVTGGAGFLGRSVVEQLCAAGAVREQIFVPRRKDFDLTTEEAVKRLYDVARPSMVIHLAAEVGGIGANMLHPGRFFFANMAMGLHLIEQARRVKLGKFVQVGTVCAYPKFAPIPFREETIWDGYPEETNAPYGVAKKSLFVMLDAYHREYGLNSAVVVPVNLYGPGDNFDPGSSHVIPALIRKFEEAIARRSDVVECWGTGSASREFLYVDDAASGIVAAAIQMNNPDPINLGSGQEITIRDLANLIGKLCGFTGSIAWNTSKPDGQPRRCLDITKAKKLLHWTPKMDMLTGLKNTIDWWRNQARA